MSALHTVLKTLTHDAKDIAQRHTYSTIVKQLYTSHGKIIKTPSFIKTITDADPALGQFLGLLQENHLITTKHIKKLTSHIEKIYKEQQTTTHVSLVESEHTPKLTQTIEKHFTDTETTTTESIGVKVQNNHTIYKRTLDTDIKQLLR